MRFAQVAQYVRGALALVVLFSYGAQYQLLGRLQRGVAVTPALADANDWRVRVLGGLQLVVTLLAFVAFVQWFYRAYQNVHRLPRARPDYRPSMAAWCWFIPVINPWYPYKIMVEIGHYLGSQLADATRVLMGLQVVTLLSAGVTLALLKTLAPHEEALRAAQTAAPAAALLPGGNPSGLAFE